MKKIVTFLVLALVVITGCSISFGNSQPPAIAGVFKSFDSGITWSAKNMFLYSGGAGNISGVNVTNLILDPQDNKAIYLLSGASGLLFTYDAAESWQRVSQISTGKVESVAIDPQNKCVIYASFANTVLKTVDCGRSWKEVYIDTRADKGITALAVDTYNNLVIYAGNSAGDILKSNDGGGKWRVIHRLDDRIVKFLVDINDTRIMYVATSKKGIYKTTDSGNSWNDLNDGLKQYSGAFEYKNLIFDVSLPDALLLVSKYGLIKTIDGGQSWTAIKLITPPASTDIFSVAINPANNKEIYYATASTFYKTVDGGQSWITKRLPSGAVATYLMVDPINPSILYMGMTNFTK